ncbi:GGDEF domain-containing protein [Fumia xinanensis]|uniref:Diguanylate cyclase n=1 Tax=Fumia xinanensis TaxID=2763659 RepID=A0A926E3I6_9FIRM|nr:GGDEF domain-containing protein [Fumia xinanensis]MBC8559449.1 diguanylate cyclase [Fumia xinanensis]
MAFDKIELMIKAVITMAFDKLKALIRESSDYLQQDEALICEQNLGSLKTVTVVYTLILSAYTILAFTFFQSQVLNFIYLICLAVQYSVDGLIFYLLRKKAMKAREVQHLCSCMSIMIASFVILVSIFPFPERPAIFFAPVLVGISVIFILSFHRQVILLSCYMAVYCVLVICFKAQNAVRYDIWAAIPSYAISVVCAYNIAVLRLRDYRSRLRFQQLSIIDKPTGVFNKATTEELCDIYLKHLDKNSRCALIILDMDNFKDINDSYGHLEGDRVLSKIGTILQDNFHKDDVVGRIGGDEFLVLMKGIKDREAAVRRGHELITKANAAFPAFSRPQISCSLGIAVSEAGNDYPTLFQKADEALYEAKKRGKSQWAIYSIAEK